MYWLGYEEEAYFKLVWLGLGWCGLAGVGVVGLALFGLVWFSLVWLALLTLKPLGSPVAWRDFLFPIFFLVLFLVFRAVPESLL